MKTDIISHFVQPLKSLHDNSLPFFVLGMCVYVKSINLNHAMESNFLFFTKNINMILISSLRITETYL